MRAKSTATGRSWLSNLLRISQACAVGWWSRLSRRARLLVATFLILLTVSISVYFWLFAGLPDVNKLYAGLHIPSIRITDRNGRLLYEIIGENAGRNTVVPMEKIPLSCREAAIATEDASYYDNPGVDLRGIVRAVWINLQGGEVVSGGSTITQQVARNLLLDPKERTERTLTRKLRESILAFQITQKYSKDDILALYLNQTYYGNLAYGIDAASRAYFGKPVEQLDLAECALLAGLPQSPADYDPLTDPQAAEDRQEVVLDLMAANQMITVQAAETAKKEPLVFAGERYSIEAPHFVSAVYSELEAALPPETLLAGGLEVRTTLDLDWQREAERIARRQLAILNEPKPNDPPHNAHDAALVALDPHSGQVLVMLGSPDAFDPSISGGVNMALAPRQPGSTLKPFTYAAAFDPAQPDPWTAATMILDVRTSFVTHDGFSYTPVNYDHEQHGPVLARTALASSYNVPAVITLQYVGIDRLFGLLGRLGMTAMKDPADYDLALTLGGGEVRLLELTAGYAAFANGGKAIHPILILEVRDAKGDIVYAPAPQSGLQVLDPRVAWLITDILSDNYARAPTFTTHSILQIGRPAAAKTGTTTDFRDNWTIGYTPNLVVGAWVGNANNEGMVYISGISGAGPIWHNFMTEILKGQPELSFQRPDGLVQVEVCALSGLLPTPDCPATIREWFIEGTQPTGYDTLYQRVTIDTATGLPATDATPPDRRLDRVFLDLPPQAHDWARHNGLPLLPDGFAMAGSASDTLGIISPDARNIFVISTRLPIESQKIRIAAAGPAGMRDVTLYLDGVPLATVKQPPFEVLWILEAGKHAVYAEGLTADDKLIRSEIVEFTVKPSN